ncbi:hypothetical protein AYL99_07426 [Fonsecaea erecta]|uniref:Uncharacterized protein n=1 Tax=Fonsecaea erecta TaxID=1367422 RepID=A0A178ZFT3_9EURO|nr:hypothetical protein AYL99_07426 [Fonsecaea erecta]OAP58336.1 hypothetical protein AYL99_07426 [Fonsecaea erecta]
MSVELTPLRAMLDSIHDDLPTQRDHNAYVLGELGKHNVVIAVLPCIGNNVSGVAANQMLHDFPSIRFVLLVGIGGGVPGNQETEDIRLGDVVVSQPTDTTGGVIQFDRGKRHCGAYFERTGCLNKPPAFLSATVEKLKAQHRQEGNQMGKFVSDMLKRNRNLCGKYRFPGRERDQLFESEYEHAGAETCQNCDATRVKRREDRAEDQPRVHYGTIGSSSSVIKDAMERDKLKQKYKILCIEMEAAGLMDAFPCLVIRGICDYADSHKNKEWQPYAAAAAAAYAKELLLAIPAQMPPIPPVLYTPSPANHGDAEPNPRNDDTTLDKQSRYQRLLQWLTFVRMDARLRNITDALPQTCKWLFKEEKFKMWIERIEIEDHLGFLWIKGKPGSGKSTIMKEALKTVKRSHPEEIIVSYFFNARAPGHLEKSSVGMYRSLVHQILQSCPHFRGHFTEMFTAKDREGVIDDWTPAELQGFLNDVVENLENRSLNIFIDALDEGDENDVRLLIAFLEDLSVRAATSGTSVRICLSSRHYPYISIRKGLSLVMEDQDGHGNDIKTYIRRKLIGDEDPEYETLRDKVYRKSSRVFLWVFLVIPILNQLYGRGQPEAMERRLEEIPDDLDDLFAQILAKNSENIDSSILLLQWVLFSKRPLSPPELYLAVQSGIDPSVIEGTCSLPKEMLERYLLNCSRGLTEVTRTNPPLVQFIHETVRNFLIQGNGLAKVDQRLAGNVEGISHERLYTACLRFFDRCLSLNQNNQLSGVPERIFRPGDAQWNFRFSDYAVNFLFWHAEISEASGIPHREFLRRFQGNDSTDLQEWIQYRNSFQRYQVRNYTPTANLIYILAEQGFANLAKVLIDDKVNVNARGERYGNALQAACAGGHKQMAQLLIDSGASIDAIGGEHRHALCAAIHHKHESIMELLLGTGILPPVETLEKRLFISIARGYVYGAETLLRAGVSTRCTNNRGESPLYLAAQKNKLAVVDLLIQKGADINAQGGHSGNALQAAIACGHEQVARLLIEKGADVNAQGGYYGNALQAASAGGHEQVARLLIEKGADVNTQGGFYGDALQAAIARGHEQMARLLIENGANTEKSATSV